MKNCKWFFSFRIKGGDTDGIDSYEMDKEVRIPLSSAAEEEARQEAKELYNSGTFNNYISEEIKESMGYCSADLYFSDFQLLYLCDPIPLNFKE